VKEFRRYVKPFWYNTGSWHMGSRTDAQLRQHSPCRAVKPCISMHQCKY